jgi:pseudouridine-5'-phosphate glycosidase
MQALENDGPIVALESTVITHGLPYPENEQLAKELEGIIHKKGCMPATIAILDGVIRVGLDHPQLERLAQAKEMPHWKCWRHMVCQWLVIKPLTSRLFIRPAVA